jgi:hypothetical protein
MADHSATAALVTGATRGSGGVLPWVSVLGAVALAFVCGAAIVCFELPPSSFLSKAFIGFRAWNGQRQAAPPESEDQAAAAAMPKIDKPGATFDAGWPALRGDARRRGSVDVLGRPVREHGAAVRP